MLPDYYQILKVARNASPVAIKKAYKLRARQCHPDCGGTHEQMLKINEAWAVLRDPVSRREYDAAFEARPSPEATARAAARSKAAQASAANYPRTWAGFERWFDELGDNIVNTQYGEQAWSAPKSSSGCLFWIVGAILGIVVWAMLGAPGPIYLAVVFGAGLGVFVHKEIQLSLKRKAEQKYTNSFSTPRSHVVCQGCSQKLRVPSSAGGNAKLRCPTCGRVFQLN